MVVWFLFIIYLKRRLQQQIVQIVQFLTQFMTPQPFKVEPIATSTMALHLLTLLLTYAYIKEELTFHFVWVLMPSIFVFLAEGYQIVKSTKGINRAKYLISYSLLFMFLIVFSKVIKNQGGMTGQPDDSKWLVRHRKCFQLLALAIGSYIFYSIINNKKQESHSLVKEVFLSVLSSLSMPLSICSGGACNSIYISTVTSILSSFSIPLTLAVPILNILGYLLQFVGLISLYSANKWRSWAFWIYVVGMISQLFLQNWMSCIIMIIATVMNAKLNSFVYGKNRKMFKESII